MIVAGAHRIYHTYRPVRTVHQAWNIHYTLAGGALMHHEEGDLASEPGTVLIIQPGSPVFWELLTMHQSDTQPYWDVIWFLYQPQDDERFLLEYPSVRSGYSLCKIGLPEHREHIIAAMRNALNLFQSSVYAPTGLAECALREALLWCKTDQGMKEYPLQPLVVKALGVIDKTLHCRMTAADIAGKCGVSRSKLMAAFSDEMGVSLMAFREQQRMRRARQLLQGGHLSVKRVALEMGYPDLKYFKRRFKKAEGTSPAEAKPEKTSPASPDM